MARFLKITAAHQGHLVKELAIKEYNQAMTRKASVVVGKNEDGFYAWCPELEGCQSQGGTLEEVMANIREAIELYLETLSEEERKTLLSQEILTTSVEVHV